MPAGRPTDYTKELGDEICVRPCVYGLYDKVGNLRYIGKANNAENRLASHMRDSVRRDTPVYRWIRKNGKPEMRILELDCADWKESERRLIAEARASGARLLNVAEGGDEPHCSIEVRRKNAAKMNSPTNMSNEELIIYTYSKVHSFYKNNGFFDKASGVLNRMILVHSMKPGVVAAHKRLCNG